MGHTEKKDTDKKPLAFRLSAAACDSGEVWWVLPLPSVPLIRSLSSPLLRLLPIIFEFRFLALPHSFPYQSPPHSIDYHHSALVDFLSITHTYTDFPLQFVVRPWISLPLLVPQNWESFSNKQKALSFLPFIDIGQRGGGRDVRGSETTRDQQQGHP